MHMSPTSSLVPLAARYRPFDHAEIVVTLKTRLRHTVHAEADFASDGEAQDALEAVRASLLAAGWKATTAGESVAANTTLYSDAAAIHRDAPKGLIVDLFTLGTRLYFSCSDATLKRQAEKEAPAPPSPR